MFLNNNHNKEYFSTLYYLQLEQSYINSMGLKNLTYLEALINFGINVPHMCYHRQLPISGNCRLCLGLVKNDRKPSPLCVTSIRLNEYIEFDTFRVKLLRENIIEFLFLNHAADCPHCDQAGECDLQDLAYNFGSDRSKDDVVYKKTILNKKRGVLVKTAMNRCINCTRCVRFFSSVAGTDKVGIMGRGIESEISSYIEDKFDDCEFSGCVIDLCPVGALTSLPNSFIYRRSELTEQIPTFDALDSLGSSICLYYKGLSIVRVDPIENKKLNETWISDKARYMYSGLYRQRILRPTYCVRIFGESFYYRCSWSEIFSILDEDIHTNEKYAKLKVCCYFGELLNNETIYTISKFMDIIGSPNKYNLTSSLYINNDFNSEYFVNSSIESINTISDACVIFGSNFKTELPLLNIRLRRRYLATALPIINFGSKLNLMYPTYQAGFTFKSIIQFCNGKSNICKLIINKKNPLFFINLNMFINETIYKFFNNIKLQLLSIFHNINKNNFNYIHPDLAVYNNLYLNTRAKYMQPFSYANIFYLINPDKAFLNLMRDDVYLFLDDEMTLSSYHQYLIYQSHHILMEDYEFLIDVAAPVKIFLPSKFYFEETRTTCINLEGDLLINQCDKIPSSNISRDNIFLIYNVFKILYNNLLLNFENVLDFNNSIYKENPLLNPISDDCYFRYNFKVNFDILKLYIYKKLQTNYIQNFTINSTIYNFYQNDLISSSSSLMAKCNKTLVKKFNYFF